MADILSYSFVQNAILASILASIVCGIIGVIIVEKKLVMMSGGIAHTAYGGVGLGYLLGFEPIIGAGIFAVIAALGIGKVKRSGNTKSDVIIALFWSLGMALGIAFVGLMPGYPPNLDSYLFGNILSVTKIDTYMIAVMAFIVVITMIVFFNDWKAYLFDEKFAKIIKIKTVFLDNLLLILVAITVVTLIRVVGIILIIALLTAPAAISGLFTDKLKNRMFIAIGFGIFFCLLGLVTSYIFNIASGATIIIVAVITYFTLNGIKYFKNHK